MNIEVSKCDLRVRTYVLNVVKGQSSFTSVLQRLSGKCLIMTMQETKESLQTSIGVSHFYGDGDVS